MAYRFVLDTRCLACRWYSAVDITLHEGSSRTDRTYQLFERGRRVYYSVLCCSSEYCSAKYPHEPDEPKAHEPQPQMQWCGDGGVANIDKVAEWIARFSSPSDTVQLFTARSAQDGSA
jgi:hypothetical protein